MIKVQIRLFIIVICYVFFFSGCKQREFVEVMAVTTDSVLYFGDGALAYGSVIDEGEGIETYGHCWSLNELPTIEDSHTSFNAPLSTINFKSDIPDIDSSIYYVRSYVKNKEQIYYGESIYFGDTAEYIKVFRPHSSTTWTMGELGRIGFRNLKNESYDVELYVDGEFVMKLEGGVRSSKNCKWDVPLDVILSDKYQVKITGLSTGYVSISDYFRIRPRQPIGADMVFVNGGEYKMGSNSGKSDESPVHKVALSNFEINRYEVTNKQYAEFLNINKSESVKGDEYSGRKMIELGGSYDKEKCRIYLQDSLYLVEEGYENHPVVYVTWYGAMAFCRYYGGRLPYEAEWEYAARGGVKSESNLYAGGNQADEVGWHEGNTFNRIKPVGKLKANELGIYDMSGNVWEWCSDWYSDKYYEFSAIENPEGPESGTYKVRRGGCWDYDLYSMRSTQRGASFPDQALSVVGFRLVRPRL